MARKTSEELKSVFQNGDLPNEQDFSDLIDSCINEVSGFNGTRTFTDNSLSTHTLIISAGLIASWTVS
jgi:hypothetical protein